MVRAERALRGDEMGWDGMGWEAEIQKGGAAHSAALPLIIARRWACQARDGRRVEPCICRPVW